jgi:SAM-dependent methyltransferase
VPVHDVQLLRTRADALECVTGDIDLSMCSACGFLWNSAFREELLDYSHEYESTQAFSPTFNRFHERLAVDLVERFDLEGRTVLEIGCGQGEFLDLLTAAGVGRGIGYDPACRREETEGSLQFIPDYYNETTALPGADLICCKMTLEHIPQPAETLRTVRRSVGDEKPIIFFQIPDVLRILREQAFWDVYYEHCSYFSAGSLARVFRRCGFEVVDVWRGYGDQYLMIEARPGDSGAGEPLAIEEDPADLAADAERFAEAVNAVLGSWRERLARLAGNGGRLALWGGGSKAVAFLTALSVSEAIPYVVDINPNKSGTFLAGSGVPVVGPAKAAEDPPDLIVVMNPVYKSEIAADLAGLGVDVPLETVEP